MWGLEGTMRTLGFDLGEEGFNRVWCFCPVTGFVAMCKEIT
jgi:hypothetical protein